MHVISHLLSPSVICESMAFAIYSVDLFRCVGIVVGVVSIAATTAVVCNILLSPTIVSSDGRNGVQLLPLWLLVPLLALLLLFNR